MQDSGTLFKPQSRILALIICSLHKSKGGIQQYDELNSLLSRLPKSRDYLIKARQDAFKLISDEETKWQGINVRNHDFNEQLEFGKDFGGSGRNGRYLPAIDRYEGRFFATLGYDGKEKLLRSKHHVLIESGLYGLVLPTEPIQLYTLDVRDPEVQKIWKENLVLTNVLVEYIQTNGIERVFDLTARDDYRELIDWNIVNRETKAQALHSFSRVGAGPDALMDFAEFMNNYLLDASEEELLAIKPETQKGEVIIRNVPYTLEYLPTEDWKRRSRDVTKGQDDSSPKEHIDVIIDASNVALDNVPRGRHAKYDNILKAIDYYRRKNQIVRAIADANLRYRIDKYEVYEKALDRKTIRQSPPGIEADRYILKLAYSHPNSKIVSNDKFDDWRYGFAHKADRDIIEHVLNMRERFVRFKINGEFFEFGSS